MYVQWKWASPYGIVTNVLDCDIVVNVFELQSCYYIYYF